jgi:hypothetical protein
MKKIFNFLLLFFLLFEVLKTQAQCPTTVIASNNSTSGNFRGMNPNWGRGTSVFLITASEMAAAGFSSGNSIVQVGGAFTTAPSIATTGNLEIRFENTTDVVNNKSTTWATAISTMTVAHNATTTIPNALTWNVTLGTPFTYTGGGLYISYEWTNCGTLATGSVVACNTALAGVKSAQTTACAAIATVSANSTFRPATTLAASGTTTNISLVSAWPHGKIPAGAGAPESIPFTVRSTYATAQTTNANLLIKEAISGTVRYTQTLPITIPSCGELTSQFTGWMPSIQETDSVIVTIDPVAGESNLLDNESRKTEIVGNNAYTHLLNGFSGSRIAIGFNTGSGLLLAKHSTSGCISATSVKARLSVPAVSAGNTLYGVIVSPTGAILGQSPNYITSTADSNSIVTFTFPSPVSLSNTDFYIGIAQTANVVGYFPLMTESEALTKPNTYYSTGLAGGALSAPYTNLGRLDLELEIAATPAIYTSIPNQAIGYCPGTTFNIGYVVNNATINAGNVYMVELSDASGSFITPQTIGTLASTNTSGTISVTLPTSLVSSAGYRIRTTSSNTGVVGCANLNPLNVYDSPTFSSVTATDATCNGGSNGTITAISFAPLASYSLSALAPQNLPGVFSSLSAATYTVTVTDGNTCTATSSIAVGQPTAVLPSIAATPLCTGGSASLTGSATGGTPGYTYQWITGYTTGTLVLEPQKDNTIFQDLPGNSNGAGVYLAAGNDGTNSPRRALMKFDLSSIPAGATITSASLTMNCNQTSGAAGAQDQTLHAITQDWGEGTSNGPGGIGALATPNDATWINSFTPSTAWSTAGGSFNPIATAIASVNAVGSYTWSNAGMTADVQYWFSNPATNFGWLLKGVESAANQAKRFSSREDLVVANRPTLTITYDVPVYASGNPLSISSPGTYTLIATDANGCTATTSTIVGALALPSVGSTTVPSPATVCLGNNVTLNGTGALSYTWSDGTNTPTDGVAFAPASSSTYTVTGTDINGCSNTNTVAVTVNTAPSPVIVEDSVCAPGGVVNLSASGTQVSWYDQLTGGTLLNTGLGYNPTISSTTTYYVENSTTITSAPTAITMPAQTSSFSGNVRGYWFTAPTNFTITSLQVPTTASSGLQSIAVVKFTGNIPPPVYSSTTNAFTTLYVTQSNSLAGNIPVSIPISTGDVIGILGVRGNVNSYSNSGNTITIAGFSAPLTRLGMQFQLATTLPQDLWTEPSSLNISRVDFEYTTTIPGCTSSPRVPVTGTVLPNPTVTASPATQDICENAQAIVSGGGASTYVWTGGVTDATPFTVTSSSTYTVTGTDLFGCSSTATAVVNMNAAPLVTASATPSTTCNNSTVTPMGGGASTYVWSGGLTDNTPFVATTGTTTYTVTGTDGIGCTATNSVTVTVNAASGTLAPSTSNQAQNQADDFSLSYYDPLCNLIATVDDGAGGNILGLTTATVNVDANAGVHNGQPFVRRWYQITPSNNVGVSAIVTLYIDQADFTNYNNAVASPYLPMPTSGNNSDPNITNIRITKNSDAGLGNTPEVITPTTINWNGNYWELTFPVTGFSQFRVHSANPGNTPLPATITKFNGRKLNSSDMLEWTTASEQNNAYFNLQHSTNGVDFKTIAKVNSKAQNGNSQTELNYGYEHTTPSLGHNYYRLEQVDIDNQSTINTKIVDLIWGANGSTVSMYPNPTQDVLNIDLYTSKVQNTTVKVLDMSGRVVKQIQARSEAGMSTLSISLGELASGVYTVQVYENDKLSHVGKVKKN